MAFQNIVCKLGNMRKEQDWVLYPQNDANTVTIQCEQRIARVDLTTGKALLSSGKKGNGFVALSKMLGAVEVDAPEAVVARLKELTAGLPVGEPVRVM